MLPIKRLYTFILQTFAPVFFMTFFICLFILLMQFLWRYIEDLVGKGLDNTVIGELFFYASLNMIPMALPLSILLASLMTFGNMGERLELLAIKAAGVSLFKAMRPLIILVTCIAIGAFFFQNEAMPRINIKFKTLLSSIRHTSPELEIPEGSFYNGIENYSIYVSKKDPETRLLHDMMIYDKSGTFKNMTVTVCDSARMRVSEGKDFLLLNLYKGKRFANVKDGSIITGQPSNTYASRQNKFVPYYREQFDEETIVIPFDGDFDRMDESVMDGHQSAKNIAMLNQSIDSLTLVVDSMNVSDRKALNTMYFSYRKQENTTVKPYKNDQDSLMFMSLSPDSILGSFNKVMSERIYNQAASDADRSNSHYMFQLHQKVDIQRNLRYHEIELHRKFTLSFACLVFFFIGAPLGAIIRKGGLGMPVIISVLFFIIYYIFDTLGVKMARDGVWNIWQGIWLSSIILFPIGVFLTYKAMNDSNLFNTEAYGRYIRKALGLKIKNKDSMEVDVNPDDVPDLATLNADPVAIEHLSEMDSNALKEVARNHKQYGYDENTLNVIFAILKQRGDSFFGVRVKNLDYEDAKNDMHQFKIAAIACIVIYFLSIIADLSGSVLAIVLVNVVYAISLVKMLLHYQDFYTAIDKKNNSRTAALRVVGLILLPFILVPSALKEMKEELNLTNW